MNATTKPAAEIDPAVQATITAAVQAAMGAQTPKGPTIEEKIAALQAQLEAQCELNQTLVSNAKSLDARLAGGVLIKDGPPPAGKVHVVERTEEGAAKISTHDASLLTSKWRSNWFRAGMMSAAGAGGLVIGGAGGYYLGSTSASTEAKAI